jgi:hypothetical protein
MGRYSNFISSSSGKKKWKREDVATILIDFQTARADMSQRQFAKDNGISRTSLQHWLSRKHSIDASPEIIEFFESPFGIAFLHRMITAAHFEFCKNGPASIHNVSNFLKLCGLAPFVAASYSSQRNVAEKMDKAIISFGGFEQEKLKGKMPEKWISLCEDETFHPEICMVAMEAVSNFIILEEYVENRNGQTWNRVVEKALEGLPVKVIQVTSDEAKGLINHTEKGLGAHHSPDAFHVSYEIGKGTSGALNSKIKKAEKQVEIITKQAKREIQSRALYDNQPKRPRGRRPNFEKRIADTLEHKEQTEFDLKTAIQNKETVQQAKQQIGKCYHPFDPETGERQNDERVAELLDSNFGAIYGAITGLSDRCKKRVEKAHRVVKDMVANVAFFLS